MRLNLGAGDQKLEGYKSVDISDKCKPDYVWDVREIPYPWNDVEEVRADNLFEHIEQGTLIKVINEIHRILKPGGKLWIRVPHIKFKEANLRACFTDPTHVNYFTIGTFTYWEDRIMNNGSNRWKDYGKDYGIIPWSKVDRKEWEDNDTFLIVEMTK